jgi:hypothetical protein
MNKEEILQLHNNGEIIVIKNLFNNVLSWLDFIKLIDHVSSKEYNSSNIRKEPISSWNEEFYIRIADVVDPITKRNINNIIPQLDNVLDFFDDIFNEKVNYAECYANLTSNSSIKPAHNDQWTAVAWNCVGSVEWRIYKDVNKDIYKSYIVSPGDVIVIPKGVLHSVVANEPRMSISLGYQSDKNII